MTISQFCVFEPGKPFVEDFHPTLESAETNAARLRQETGRDFKAGDFAVWEAENSLRARDRSNSRGSPPNSSSADPITTAASSTLMIHRPGSRPTRSPRSIRTPNRWHGILTAIQCREADRHGM